MISAPLAWKAHVPCPFRQRFRHVMVRRLRARVRAGQEIFKEVQQVVEDFISRNEISVFVKKLQVDKAFDQGDVTRVPVRYGCLLSRGKRQIAVYLSLHPSCGRPSVEDILRILGTDACLAMRPGGAAWKVGDPQWSGRGTQKEGAPVQDADEEQGGRTGRARKLRRFLGQSAFEDLVHLVERHLCHDGRERD